MQYELCNMFLHVFDMDRFYTMDGSETTKLATRLTKYYEFQCDDRVAIHIVFRNRGFKYAATYNQFVDTADDVLHWCQTLAPDSYRRECSCRFSRLRLHVLNCHAQVQKINGHAHVVRCGHTV